MNRLRTPAAGVARSSSSCRRGRLRLPQIESGTAATLVPAIGRRWSSRRFTTNRTTPIRWSCGCTATARTSGNCVRLMPQISLRNYIAVAPRGTATVAFGGKRRVGVRLVRRRRRRLGRSTRLRSRSRPCAVAITSRRAACSSPAPKPAARPLCASRWRIPIASPARCRSAASFPTGGTPLSRLHRRPPAAAVHCLRRRCRRVRRRTDRRTDSPLLHRRHASHAPSVSAALAARQANADRRRSLDDGPRDRRQLRD